MRCWGRTRTLKRCSREGTRLFCHDHRWQPFLAIGSIVTVLLSTVALYKEVLTPLARFINKSLPAFTLSTSGIGVPDVGTTVTLLQIKNYKRHTLTITNRSNVRLRDMRLRLQFPESIIAIRSVHPTSAHTVSASADWERTEFEILGQPDARFEATPNEELTGLWRVHVPEVAAHDVVGIEITTTAKAERGLGLYPLAAKSFNEAFPRIQRSQYWMVNGTYEVGTADTRDAEEFVVPLRFDESTRVITALASVKANVVGTNVVRIAQAPGFRVPGFFRTAGVVLITRGADEFNLSPIMTESQTARFSCRIKLAGRFVNIAVKSNSFHAVMPIGSTNFEAVVPLNKTLTIPLDSKSK
jgi:hypothetical protein